MPPSYPSITTDEELRRELRRLADLAAPPEPLHLIGATGEPAFENAWVNNDNTATTPGYGANRDAGFYEDRGRVHLTGVIKTGVSATTAFTLPVGYRPKASVDHLTNAAGFALVAELQIAATGTVVPRTGTGNVSTYCFLDGVSFLAA